MTGRLSVVCKEDRGGWGVAAGWTAPEAKGKRGKRDDAIAIDARLRGRGEFSEAQGKTLIDLSRGRGKSVNALSREQTRDFLRESGMPSLGQRKKGSGKTQFNGSCDNRGEVTGIR